MLTVRSVRNPTWCDAKHTAIDALVMFEEHADTYGEMPFTIHPEDCMEHGQAMYAAAVAGEYGEIAEYVAPVVSSEKAQASAREWRDAELKATQWIVDRHRDEADCAVDNTITKDAFAELVTYRRLLRDWPTADGFPSVESRPAKPSWL